MSRGAAVKMRRSLKTRVTAACTLAFLGLGAMTCLVLPQAYEFQGRQALRERTEILAKGTAFLIQQDRFRPDGLGIQSVSGWLDGDPDFESAVLLDADGRLLDWWPDMSAGWDTDPPIRATHTMGSGHFSSIVPVSGMNGPVAAVGLRTSTDRLHMDIQNVRWLFASIFLFICGVFWILTTYLTRGILRPLEDIRQAAMSLADGEPIVDVPQTGDHEIDELGQYIASLGSQRRASTVMQRPSELLRQSAHLKAQMRKAGNSPPAVSASDEEKRSDS
jgi:HAMP domain-containing protein